MDKNYIPLYRKYRPQTIDQIVGQEHIKKALTNAIQMDRISHAYLFTGPRGTGKTSTARIFAKSLNCVNGPTITPCNECENCKNITNSIPIDVIEIDAASNRSVNDADEIIQKVALQPVQSRYKIYIIDEVHMLTNQAFNALLKTLEEPPKNVIFILATTEVHKVLDTIKSRCQRFDFKRITTGDIVKHLRYIADNEKINITDDALLYIAQNSAGGMRDSIALLDQLSVLNSSDRAISVDDINSLLGRLSFVSLTSLFSAITSSNQNEALKILNDIYNQGNEPSQILSNLLEYFRNALILKTVGDNVSNMVVQLNEEQMKQLSEILPKIETHQLISLIDKCANYIKELKLTANPKLWLDVAVLDMANLVENTKLDDLQKRISQLESGDVVKMVNTSPYNTPPSPVKKQDIMQASKQEAKPKQSQTVSQSVKPQNNSKQTYSADEVLTDSVPISKSVSADNLKLLWAKLLENISSFPSRTILKQQAIPVKITEDEVIISIKNQSWLKQFGPEGAKHSFIVQAAAAVFGKNVEKIVVRMPESGDNEIRKEQSSASPSVTVQGQSDNSQIQNKEPAASVETAKEKVKDSANISDIEASEPEEIQKAPLKPDNNADNKIVKETVHKVKNLNSSADSFHSDEVNMVMDLFDGKIIE